MKTVLVYNPVELAACAMMVQRFNTAFQNAPLAKIEESIERCMEYFKDEETAMTGTMGFLIVATDEYIEDDVRKVSLEFYFHGNTYAHGMGMDVYDAEYVEKELK